MILEHFKKMQENGNGSPCDFMNEMRKKCGGKLPFEMAKETYREMKERDENVSPFDVMQEVFKKMRLLNSEPSAPEPEPEQEEVISEPQLEEKIRALKREAKVCRQELKMKKREKKMV